MGERSGCNFDQGRHGCSGDGRVMSRLIVGCRLAGRACVGSDGDASAGGRDGPGTGTWTRMGTKRGTKRGTQRRPGAKGVRGCLALVGRVACCFSWSTPIRGCFPLRTTIRCCISLGAAVGCSFTALGRLRRTGIGGVGVHGLGGGVGIVCPVGAVLSVGAIRSVGAIKLIRTIRSVGAIMSVRAVLSVRAIWSVRAVAV